MTAINKISIFIISLIVIFSAAGTGWYYYEPESGLEVDFLDVGQGDSVLIKAPGGQNILIDGGYDNKLIKRLSENLKPWDRTIDLMILTHPHDDHVTGLVETLKRYEVKKVMATGVIHSTSNYLAWLTEIRDQKIPLVIIEKPQTVDLGEDCFLEIIYPLQNIERQEVDNLNNTSIAARLIYRDTAFFLGGDIEKEVEEELLLQDFNLKADVMKASHHGSYTSNTEEFIKAVDPEIAVFNIGRDNKFSLPDNRIVKRFERLGSRILRTDIDGTVKILSDGVEVSLQQ